MGKCTKALIKAIAIYFLIYVSIYCYNHNCHIAGLFLGTYSFLLLWNELWDKEDK